MKKIFAYKHSYGYNKQTWLYLELQDKKKKQSLCLFLVSFSWSQTEKESPSLVSLNRLQFGLPPFLPSFDLLFLFYQLYSNHFPPAIHLRSTGFLKSFLMLISWLFIDCIVKEAYWQYILNHILEKIIFYFSRIRDDFSKLFLSVINKLNIR